MHAVLTGCSVLESLKVEFMAYFWKLLTTSGRKERKGKVRNEKRAAKMTVRTQFRNRSELGKCVHADCMGKEVH